MNSAHQNNNLATHGNTSFQNTLFTDTKIALQCVWLSSTFLKNKQHLIFRPVGLDVVFSDVEHVYSIIVVFCQKRVLMNATCSPTDPPNDLPTCQEQ